MDFRTLSVATRHEPRHIQVKSLNYEIGLKDRGRGGQLITKKKMRYLFVPSSNKLQIICRFCCTSIYYEKHVLPSSLLPCVLPAAMREGGVFTNHANFVRICAEAGVMMSQK